jgi:ribonuclease HI
MGTALQNDKGEALASFAAPLTHLLNAAMVGASALLKGLEFLEQMGIQSCIIESNSLELIQACNAEVEIWSPSAAILVECFMKAQGFTLICYRHCSREDNQVAHELATVRLDNAHISPTKIGKPTFSRGILPP